MSWIWIVAAILVVLAGCAGGNIGKTGRPAGPYRIDRMHYIDADDYECSVCGSRFRKKGMVCPKCGARFAGTEEDDGEFIEEMIIWDDDD